MLKGKKYSQKIQNKHQNQIQTWQIFWNYQTGNFKITMINVPRELVEKVDNMQEQLGNVSRKMETKKESKRNDANQKHCNKNEEYL